MRIMAHGHHYSRCFPGLCFGSLNESWPGFECDRILAAWFWRCHGCFARRWSTYHCVVFICLRNVFGLRCGGYSWSNGHHARLLGIRWILWIRSILFHESPLWAIDSLGMACRPNVPFGIDSWMYHTRKFRHGEWYVSNTFGDCLSVYVVDWFVHSDFT